MNAGYSDRARQFGDLVVADCRRLHPFDETCPLGGRPDQADIAENVVFEGSRYDREIKCVGMRHDEHIAAGKYGSELGFGRGSDNGLHIRR